MNYKFDPSKFKNPNTRITRVKEKVTFKSYKSPIGNFFKAIFSKQFYIVALLISFISSIYIIISLFGGVSFAGANNSENGFFKIYTIFTNTNNKNSIDYKLDDNFKPKEKVPTPVTNDKYVQKFYVVKKGDTLFDIAKTFNMTIKELLEVNLFEQGTIIVAGQVITVYAR
jgi:LysM repeat protein